VVERDLPIQAYKVDAVTGEVITYPYEPEGFNSVFFDVAILSDGTALFSDLYSDGGSALKLLDLATGNYTNGPVADKAAVLSPSETGSYVLFGDSNSSAGSLYVYETGTGVIASTVTMGFNFGVQAISPSGDLVAKYDHQGILIYNADLQLQTTLTGWTVGQVTDLAFDPSGQFLFVLDNEANTIIELRVSDWSVVTTIPVGADLGTWGGQIGSTLGSRLIVDPGERYFSVATDSGLVLVANPSAPPIVGTENADVLQGLLFADTIQAGAGNDTLSGGAGNDTLDGGGGMTVSMAEPAPTRRLMLRRRWA
jgi:Ca2+-binding RTX toxin-like protein